MRNVLMGSGFDFILLENELEILKDYLRLQRLRNMGKFDNLFEAEYNGKGINEQLSEERKNGHISMTTKITRKRMLTLEQLTKIKCNLEIINRTDNSEQSGVLVIITIPFN